MRSVAMVCLEVYVHENLCSLRFEVAFELASATRWTPSNSDPSIPRFSDLQGLSSGAFEPSGSCVLKADKGWHPTRRHNDREAVGRPEADAEADIEAGTRGAARSGS